MTGPDPQFCPPHLRESIEAYVEDGRPVGSFLQAVLENDLREAIAHADQLNLWIIPHVVAYLWHCVPAPVWGSPEAVARHLKAKRNESRAERERLRKAHADGEQLPFGKEKP